MNSNHGKQPDCKIFGIGLSKTGTTSLYAALSQLGYRSGTYGHMKALGLEEWFRGDFSRDYFRDYDAMTDLPLGCLFPQLDDRYPGSKFIMTVRDLDSWLDSCRRQFTRRKKEPAGFDRDVRMSAYGTSRFNEKRFRYIHRTHRDNVEWYFRDRPEDLLVLDLFSGEGWAELCSFLDRGVPDVQFPNVKPGFRVGQ